MMRVARISIVCVLVLVGALLVGCSQAASTQSAPSAPTIDAAAVSALEDGAYLVDTRTFEEYAKGHIPGALSASYPKSGGETKLDAESMASFRAEWKLLDIPTDAHVVLYCRTGVRAAAAASVLLEDGYTNVEVYEGSWTDWSSDPSRSVERI